MPQLHGLIFDLEGTLIGDAGQGFAKELCPGAAELLDYFRARHVLLGLCTNRPQQSTLKITAELGIRDSFDFIAGGDLLGVRKPDPRHVTGVIENLGLTAEHCAMIGDSTNDVWAARGASIPCIVIRAEARDMSLGETAAISSLSEAPSMLRRLGFDFID
ncbi:MAG: HAD-IA family hydrolase [Alphaproteobacteria bacterium]|nr:HAD-IA family hydrolase [Alphaproteobacteria bacterium]